MQVNTGKLQILTVAAMLVLVSGGIAAYAQNQTSSSSSSSSSSSTSASTTTANHALCQSPSVGKTGRLVLPITAAGQSSGNGALSFSEGDGCVASITAAGGVFDVHLSLRFVSPMTQYQAVLVANGTSHTLGSMVAGPAGSAQMENQVLLTNGTYLVSIQIYDTSSSPGQSILVLQTGQGTIASQPFPADAAGPLPPQARAQGWQGDQPGQDQWPTGHK